MISETRSRRLPVRACDALAALAGVGAGERWPGDGAQFVRAQGYDVRRDRLACEVVHRIELEPGVRARLWWLSIGRPLYEAYVEDAFDELARATGSPVRRPARLMPYARLARAIFGGSTSAAAKQSAAIAGPARAEALAA